MSTIVEQLDPIFKPRSIAIIGALNMRGKWGYRLISLPLKSGYRGAVYPVNPAEKSVLGIPACDSVLDIKSHIDLAVIVVPAPAVLGVMQECVQKGIKGAVIITAGFAETGREGAILQERIVAAARKGGLRFVGPNGMGIFSSAGNLNLCFSRTPISGSIAFVSQSGTYGVSLAQAAVSKGYGLSKFISIGNQADLTAADYLEYLAEDSETSVIVFYLEGFKDGSRFFRLAKEVVKKKPVIIYKGGRTQAGSRATITHTGSLAGQGHIFDAMCRQSGILQTDEIMQPFDMAEALAHLPLPNGKRIGILGSGGQGVVLSDACNLLGLEVPEFDKKAQAKLKKNLPAHAAMPRNPLDFAGGDRTALGEAEMVEQVAQLTYIDGIITHAPFRMPPGQISEELSDNIAACQLLGTIVKKHRKPLIILRHEGVGGGTGREVLYQLLKAEGIPSYDSPEQCALAMYALAKYAEVKAW